MNFSGLENYGVHIVETLPPLKMGALTRTDRNLK